MKKELADSKEIMKAVHEKNDPGFTIGLKYRIMLQLLKNQIAIMKYIEVK
jgi:hypothetical protein